MLSRLARPIGHTVIRKVTMRSLSSEGDSASVFKVEPARMKLVITPELEKLVYIFQKYNHEIRIAGGAVRDLISGEKIPDDVDLATTATPTEMKEMFTTENIRMINELGEKHGTITARIDDKENFEVTTLRIDKVTDGRHAEVEFTRDWKIDAERRDLTINSMFLDFDGTVIDFFSGRQDLQNKLVAFVGSPVKRMQEDYLRILRYFRFFGRICSEKDQHEEATLEAIKSNVHGLERISGERIWMEWKKILQGNLGGPLTLKMIELGVGPYIGLPKNPDLEKFQNIWMSKKNSVHPVTLLAHLLKTQEEMTDLNLRLKMSGFERDLGYFLLQNRDSAAHDLKHWQSTLVLSKNKSHLVKEWIIQQLICDDRDDLVEDFKNWEIPRFPVNGRDLKEEGVKNGKLMGKIIDELKKEWIESDFKVEREHLLKVSLPKVSDALLELSPNQSKYK